MSKREAATPSEDGDDPKRPPPFDPIAKAIGSFGKWQVLVLIPAFIIKFPVAWHQLSIVLIAPPAKFNCTEPENTTDACSKSCTHHEFDRSVFEETIITQWDLVCNNRYLADLTQTVVMLGILVGSMVFGSLSDKYGRKLTLFGAVPIQILSGIGAAFIPNFWIFLVMKFLNAFATGGTMVTSFVFVMELVGSEWRAFIGVIYQIPFNIGHLTLAVFGYYIRDWRYFQLAITLPVTVVLFFFTIQPESPRWLLATGQTEKTIALLKKGADFNHLPIDEIENDIRTAVAQKEAAQVGPKKKASAADLVKTPNMRIKSMCICYNWVVFGVCFFGVSQYLGQIGGNIFANVALSGAVQIPGVLLTVVFLRYLGRKWTQIVANLGSGICCLLIPFVPSDPAWIQVSLAVFGVFWLSICYTAIYVWSGELFPTVVRNVGIGIASMFARFGSMLAPFVAGLNATNIILPPLIFGIVPVLGAISCIFLPETLGFALPDTIEDGEKFGKKKYKGVVTDEAEMQTMTKA